MNHEKVDFYKILNVDENSTLDAIRKQYRVLALKYHPDKSEANEDMFKQITNAYNVLSDAQKRREYDTILSREKRGYMDIPDRPMGGGTHAFSQSDAGLNALFKDMMTQSEKQQKVTIVLGLEDVLYGCHKAYHTRTSVPCMACKGIGIDCPEKNTIQCRECFGKGINPSIPFLSCITCGGKGVFVINNIQCKVCNGQGIIHNRTEHALYLKPGTPDKEIIHISKSIIIFVKHAIERTNEHAVRIKDGAVHFVIDVTLLDLLVGFEKTVRIGHETICLHSSAAFDTSKRIRIKNDGMMDFVFQWNLVFDDDNKELYAKIGRSLRQIMSITSTEDSRANARGPDEPEDVKLVNVNKHTYENDE